jgi:hypothetical protein
MTHTYLLEIELMESVALTDGSSDAGGGHTTLDYVPGTSLLGACVPALGIAPSDPLFARLFLSPSTRFLNAYPRIDSGGHALRALPRPLTFRVGKLDRTRVHDAVRSNGNAVDLAALQSHFANATPADTMKASRGSFVADGVPEVEHSVERVEQVHVGVDRTRRAAQQGVLFTYEAVRAGARFIGAIETEDDGVAELLDRHPTLELRIGRSRSAGYGRARGRLTKVPTSWREYAPIGAGIETPGDRYALITLLSDYLPHLESSPAAALRGELATLLGVDAAWIEVRSAKTRQVRGFRGVWGLPRPARTALAKGSVVVVKGVVDMAKLSAAVAAGVGARTNEGFGRIAVNWSIHGRSSDGSSGLRTLPAHAKQSRPTIDASSATIAAIKARRSERQIREFVDAGLRLKSVRSAVEALLPLPPAQLGNLRAAVSGTMTPAEIGAWFKALSEKTAGERWRRLDVPPIAPKKPHRAGHAFVWESLFGGECSNHDALQGNIGPDNWKAAVAAMAEQVGQPDLTKAATNQSDTALRSFIAGFVSDVARCRNTRSEEEAAR